MQQLLFSKSTSCSITREIWQYENIDLELFNNKMDEIIWNEKIGFLNDVDDMVEEFTKLVLDIARQCIPTKTITVRDYDTLKYKKQRNKVNNMKKKAKDNFESNLDKSTNPKIMKMLIKSNKRSNCIPPLRNTINDVHLDEMVYDDDTKCDLISTYLSLVSMLEEENIPVRPPPPPLEIKYNDSITDIFVTASEIVNIIQILDLKQTSAPDKISHKMLKIAPEKNVEPLQIIFSNSFRQDKYPSSWTIVHVIAILKR